MNQQIGRQLQERATTLPVEDVLNNAVRFFARQSGVYAAFPEKRSAVHVMLRGQGGEEIAIAARDVGGVTIVTASSYLFDQQIARFLDALPPGPVTSDAESASSDATAASSGAKAPSPAALAGVGASPAGASPAVAAPAAVAAGVGASPADASPAVAASAAVTPKTA